MFKRGKSKTDRSRHPNYRGTAPRTAPPPKESSAKPPGKPDIIKAPGKSQSP